MPIHSSPSRSCCYVLETLMSDLVNEIATDTPASSEGQCYLVGIRLSSRLAHRSSTYRIEGKWLYYGDACVVEHGDDVAIGKVWLPPRLPSTVRHIPQQRVIRKASEDDLVMEQRREELERVAFTYA